MKIFNNNFLTQHWASTPCMRKTLTTAVALAAISLLIASLSLYSSVNHLHWVNSVSITTSICWLSGSFIVGCAGFVLLFQWQKKPNSENSSPISVSLPSEQVKEVSSDKRKKVKQAQNKRQTQTTQIEFLYMFYIDYHFWSKQSDRMRVGDTLTIDFFSFTTNEGGRWRLKLDPTKVNETKQSTGEASTTIQFPNDRKKIVNSGINSILNSLKKCLNSKNFITLENDEDNNGVPFFVFLRRS